MAKQQSWNTPIHHDSTRDFEISGETGLGRAGGKVKGGPVRIHPGQTTRTKSGEFTFGVDSKSRIDAELDRPGQNPLDKPPQAKDFSPPKHVQGHRSRTSGYSLAQMHDVGRRVLQEGLEGAADGGNSHPMFDHLPGVNTYSDDRPSADPAERTELKNAKQK